MSPERARLVANGILTAAGVTLAIVAWRQPTLRRFARAFAPLAPEAIRETRPLHVAAAIAAVAATAYEVGVQLEDEPSA
jgi:hypothetical protein